MLIKYLNSIFSLHKLITAEKMESIKYSITSVIPMASKRKNIILSLQSKNGGDAPVVFEITKAKADKIINLIQPEIQKRREEIRCTSITLDKFFKEAN